MRHSLSSQDLLKAQVVGEAAVTEVEVEVMRAVEEATVVLAVVEEATGVLAVVEVAMEVPVKEITVGVAGVVAAEVEAVAVVEVEVEVVAVAGVVVVVAAAAAAAVVRVIIAVAAEVRVPDAAQVATQVTLQFPALSPHELPTTSVEGVVSASPFPQVVRSLGDKWVAALVKKCWVLDVLAVDIHTMSMTPRLEESMGIRSHSDFGHYTGMGTATRMSMGTILVLLTRGQEGVCGWFP